MGGEASNPPTTNWGLQDTAYGQQMAQGLQQMSLGQQQLLNQLGAEQYIHPPARGIVQPILPAAWIQAYFQEAAMPPPAPDPISEKVAEELLLRHLNNEQKTSWGKHKGFWVTAKSGRRYWLDRKGPKSAPIDDPPQSFCIYSTDETGDHLPKSDQILAQKLLIETNEALFLKTANARDL